VIFDREIYTALYGNQIKTEVFDMYREVVKVNAHGKKEAIVNLAHALRDVLASENGSHITIRVLVPDEKGDIDDSEAMRWFEELGL